VQPAAVPRFPRDGGGKGLGVVGISFRGRRSSPLVALVAALFATVVLVVSGERTGAQEQQQSYTVTDLGVFPGGSASSAFGINASGQVVGYSETSSGDRAFLYENGQMINLGTLPGASSSNAWGSNAWDINGPGQVVGYSQTSDSPGPYHAILYQNGQMIDLDTRPEGSWSEAYGVNDSGQVVGRTFTLDSNQHAFLYENGQMVDLGTFPGGSWSSAHDINGSGQVVGISDTSTSSTYGHAFLYENGQMIDLGTVPGAPSYTGISYSAAGINGSGQVVGSWYDYNSGDEHAVLYDHGQNVDLGTLPGGSFSYATRINASGQVVGGSDTSSGEHAFLYENGQMVDLNDRIPSDSGWVLRAARDINDEGQIVGSGVHNGQVRAFLLTPGAPTTKAQCKKGGWRELGYPDQGTCISDVNQRNR
jgi:probable HAF family extracellular repeat protein